MKTHHPENERIKHRYLGYFKEARRQSEASLDTVAKALSRFEAYTKYAPFRAFRIDQAMAFKRHLAVQTNARTGEVLSKATLYATLNALRNFFLWLAGQPGFKSRLSYSDGDYFNLSEKESRVAVARRERPVPTPEQIEHVVRTMTTATEIDRRNQALIAFAFLTGARDGAIASLKLKHIDTTAGVVEQDAREVNTKASKTITTNFYPVPDIFRQIVVEWVGFLRTEKLWGLNDPLFPATEVVQDTNRQFVAVGLARAHWSSAEPIRKIFRTAFTQAGLPYFNPHAFRKTLALLGEKICQTPEQFKAWSQNLGHEQVMTTFTSYGAVSRHRQAEIMRDLGRPENPVATDADLLREIAEVFSRRTGSTK